MLQCERFYGAAWFHNPARWNTGDGYVPYAVLWLFWSAIGALRAGERISAIRAQRIARGGNDAALEADVRTAYGEEE